MGQKTDIEWCDSTLNLQMGCDGCELWNPKAGVRRCYAGKITARQAGRDGWPKSFNVPTIFSYRLDEMLLWPDLTGKDRRGKPWLNGYPRVVFLNDMGDTFTESLDLDWLTVFVRPMADSSHVYIILTKRPGRMVLFWQNWRAGSGTYIPPNFWLLTSVTGPENIGRIRELLKLRALGARVLGVSYEPAWGGIDFRPYLNDLRLPMPSSSGDGVTQGRDRLDWLITGGESGARAEPSHPNWFRAARDACQEAGVAYFFKQWGEWVYRPGYGTIRIGKKAAGATLDGREWRQMPTV